MLPDVYDSEAFRRDGKQLIDLLADHFARLDGDRPGPVLDWTAPPQMLSSWQSDFSGGAPFLELMRRVLADSIQVRHPRFIGHQVSLPLPTAALADLLGSFLSNGMAIYEMGPASSAMERHVTDWLCQKVGFDDQASGILTAGGTLGNLTALLAARQSRAPYDAWEQPAAEHPPLAILCSDQAHYSVARIGRILGFGEAGIVPVPVDERYCLRPDALEGTLRSARNAGRHVIAVIANACSTATGSYDPLEPIADFCLAENLWLHVDGAHGASMLLSDRHRHLLQGIERADSIVWDLHKMMMMPALTTAVLFRRSDSSYATFAQKATYLFEGDRYHGDRTGDWTEIGLRTFECTKRMMSLRIYTALAVHGEAPFRKSIETTIARAQDLADLVEAAPDFELLIPPEVNIVCFRYRPHWAMESELDALQNRIRDFVVRSGSHYLVQTTLPTGRYLRCAIMNPFTRRADLESLLTVLREAGESMRRGERP
ncbi:MAG: pyridoxal-dependent decarboxylase [Planctomycetota bacterium]